MHKQEAELARLYRTLGNPVRLKMLAFLADGEMSRSELARKIRVPAPNFAQHLARLREARLIDVRRKEKETYYKIANPRISVLRDAAEEIYKKSYEE